MKNKAILKYLEVNSLPSTCGCLYSVWRKRVTLAALILVAVLAGCTKGDVGAGVGEGDAETRHATAERELQRLVARARAEHGFVGISAAIVMPDGKMLQAADGFAEKNTETVLEPSHKMLAGSVGKTLFGALALHLVEVGLMDLDAPISNWFSQEPWFDSLPNSHDITVRMLMNHSSGLSNHVIDERFLARVSAGLKEDMNFSISPGETIKYLLGKPPLFSAGEGFAYSDTNYILLAMIIERATGGDCYELVEREILSDSGISTIVPSDSPDVPELAAGHWDSSDNFFGIPYASNRAESGKLRYNPALEWAGGGYAANPAGLAMLAKFLYERPAVNDDLFDQMLDTSPMAELPSVNLRYGLGTMTYTADSGLFAIGHSGFFPGYRAEMYYFPEEKVSFALMINSDTKVNLYAAAMELAGEFLKSQGLR